VARIRLGALTSLLGCAAASSPPASVAAPACAVGDTALVRETLYFGRSRPGGDTISDADWQRFLAEVVTPRFPSGLTVLDATGQWKSAAGTVERERSEIVILLHPDNESSRSSVHEIALEYKRRFQQEAVLRDRTSTCARLE
jgi:hypothetical protein